MNYSSGICYSAEVCWSSIPSPTYQRHLLDLEKNFDVCGTMEWITNTWKMVFVIIGVYLVAIFAGQRFMRSRPAFQLRGPLLAWNVALASYSIFTTWRMLNALLYQIDQVGFKDMMCNKLSMQYQLSMGVHAYFFLLSKFVELGDTVFIVLRKKPLLVVHWFHHATVVFFAWSSGAYPSVIQNVFTVINTFVHSFVYSYFALKILRFRIPMLVSMVITLLELLQMIAGLYIVYYTHRMRATPGVRCCVVDGASVIALCIYFAYIVIFSNFFVKSYLTKKPSRKADAKKIN